MGYYKGDKMKKSYYLFLCLIIIFVNCFSLGCYRITRNKNEIGIIYSPPCSIHIITKDLKKYNVIDFVCEHTIFDDGFHFVQVKYSIEDFNKEITRLANINSEGTYLYYDEECRFFKYPTYIATYWLNRDYEYACIEYDLNIITYVYTISCSIDLPFDKKYLPVNYVFHEIWAENPNMDLHFSLDCSKEQNKERWYDRINNNESL